MKLHVCMYLELYDILKGKNVLVKSAYYITQYIRTLLVLLLESQKLTVLWGTYIRHKRHVFSSIPSVGNISRICKYLSYARCIQGETSLLHVTYPAGKKMESVQTICWKFSIYDFVKSGQMFASSNVSLDSV